MDDPYDNRARKGHRPRPSTSSMPENHGRVRGRTQLRQHPPPSYAMDSAAGSSEGARPSGPGSTTAVNRIWSNVRRSISQGAASKKARAEMAVSVHISCMRFRYGKRDAYQSMYLYRLLECILLQWNAFHRCRRHTTFVTHGPQAQQ